MPDLNTLKFVENLVTNPTHSIRLYVDPETGQKSIAKMLTSSSPTSYEIEMLVKEYEIASSLKGDNHLKPLGLEYQSGKPIIFYEDFSGISLDDILKQGRFDLQTFFNVAIKLTEALGNIHEQHVAHQDIKPGNIIINQRLGEYRFIDFMLAKKWTRQEEKWVAGGQGTLKYISPEQTGRIDSYIDYRTDFYSLGVTFYKMVCGRLPFESDDPGEIMHAHIARLPDSPIKVNPHIPKQLSLIILKLMAKSPKDRYKTALGIQNDLSLCFLLWKENEDVPLFELGEDDKGGTLELSTKFYGRKNEFETITKITRQRGRITPLLVMVGGLAGSGKTSFISELIKKIDLSENYFIKGKYEQYERNRPLKAIITAFSQLFETIYEREGESGKKWIKEVLGDNLSAITQLMPTLELLMGAQEKAVEVAPAEAQNRFIYNLSKIIELRATEDHPIILFLDNLQWADAASLNLIYALSINQKCPGLIIIGAYRNSEVDHAHPLSLTLHKIQNEGGIIKNVEMGPLEIEASTQMISDTLGREDKRTNALASKLYVKTGGNPLFTEQLILNLYNNEIINFDSSMLLWNWDEDQIAKVHLDVQIVDLIINKIDTLPEQTKRMLFLAASFGDEIELKILQKVMGIEEDETIGFAEKALGLGLIDLARKKEGYQLIFCHDRFREACYQIIPEENIPQEHYTFGMALNNLWEKKAIQENIFQIATLLNHAISLLNPNEKNMLAKYNLEASQSAIESFAYKQGLSFAEMGIALLSKKAWKTHYPLMLNLHENGIIAAGELKEDKQLHVFFNALLKHAEDIYDTAQSYVKVIHYLYNIGDFEGSIDLARKGLKRFHFQFPKKGSKLIVIKEYLKTRLIYWWKTRKGKERQKLTDKKIRVILDIYEAAFPSIFFTDVLLWTYCLLKQYEFMLKYGKHERELQFSIGFFYLGRAVIKDMSLPRSIFDEIDINNYKKYPNFPGIALAYCGGLRHFVSLKEFVKKAEDMFLYSLSMGNVVYSSYLYMYICTHQFSAGLSITKCKIFIADYEDLNKKIDVFAIRWVSTSMSGIYESLTTGNEYTVTIDDKKREVDSLFNWLENKGMHDQYFHLSFLMLTLEIIQGNGCSAYEYSKKGHPFRASALATPFKEHFLLYEVLAIGLCYHTKDKKEQKRMRKICEGNLKELRFLMEQHEGNYGYKYWMALGEYTRMLGDVDNAHFHYRKGIMLAIENTFLQDTAIGLERCGTLMIEQNDKVLAAIYIKQAVDFYERWGATAKVTAMNEEYVKLLSQNEEQYFGLTSDISTSSSSTQMSDLIDNQAYIGAAEAISKEIDLESLIKLLVSVVMKNAGAEHVVLLTVKKDEWFVTAEKKGGETEVNFLQLPLKEASKKVPLSIIGEVIQSKEEIVIRNAFMASKFSQDSYIGNNKTVSVLALPLNYQNNLVAILYMENSLTVGAFTAQRVQNILLLSSHIANALENAFLYKELKQYSKNLEEKVEQRKKEITEKNEALTKSNEAINNSLQELKKTQNQLVATEKLASLGELTAGVAHEIRNPLNFINNFSIVNIEMLEENDEVIKDLANQLESLIEIERTPEILELQEKGKQFLEDFRTIGENQKTILTHGKRSETIISLMEQHSHVGKGTLQETILSKLIDESLASSNISFRERYPEFSAFVQKNYEDDVDKLFTVLNEMAFVFYNVIKNALEAMQEKSEKEENYQPELYISTKRVDNMAEITIRDNGTGITKGEMDKVFNPFYTNKPTGQAIGLALSICQSIVTSIHQGTMTITSESGAFTEVKITLPM